LDMDWFNEYSVNVAELNGQHVKIFALIGRLRRGLDEKQERQAIEEVLDNLLDYTQVHFAREEQLMRENDYPDMEKHIAEHAWLQAEVRDRRKNFLLGAEAKATELGAFLYHWLRDHIAVTDKNYGPFLNSKGVE